MISISTFETAFQDFLQVYGKDLSVGAKTLWFSALSDALTDDEFIKAIAICIRDYEFLPSPKKFIESVKGTSEDFAHKDLLLIQQKRVSEISQAGKDALSLVGGTYAFTHSTNPESLRREFAKYHKSFQKNGQGLKALNKGKEPEVDLVEVLAELGIETYLDPQHQIFGNKYLIEELTDAEKLELLAIAQEVPSAS